METATTENSYKIKTPLFEGPFGLLLNLVEDRKLFINDLSLAEVTEDYLKYVNTLQEEGSPYDGRRVGEISSFVVVAATLLLIKSKSLLPNLSLTNEEEGDIRNLEERLRLYEQFSRLSLHIKSDFGKEIIFAPLERKNDTIVFLPDDQITKDSMMSFASLVLGRIPKKVPLQEVEVKKVINIEEMIDRLAERIKNSLTMNFRDFSGKSASREEKVTVIVSFLAMLELVRQGIINAIQENNSSDIMLEKLEADQNNNL